MKLNRLLVPFSSRNYRLFFSGQIASLVGNWMTQTATVWLVYHLTGSAFWLGLVSFLGQIPIVLLAPVSGVCVDRFNRLNILRLAQVLAMLQSLALAACALTGIINVRWLIGLAIFQGVINAFDMPARQAIVVQLVNRREDLPGVIGLNSSVFNFARLVGPGLAGLLIDSAGVGYCFLIDGLSFAPVLVALGLIRVTPHRRDEPGLSVWSEFSAGLRYALGFGPIRQLILTTACFTVFGLSYGVLIPVIARVTFGGDAKLLGMLMSAVGVGAVLAALYLATRSGAKGLSKVIVSGAVILGLALPVIAFSQNLALTLACLLLCGGGQILILATTNTLLQNLVDEQKRGRVLSLYGLAFLGGWPLGSLLTGTVADHLGLTAAMVLCGAATLFIAWLFHRQLPAFRRQIRAVLAPKVDVPSSVVE
ncbi:MAG: MFS transporter [Verrucomicrobiales bacterium]|jgi:MFS family permease|nr:MFS transporter [Verrucomicrobiales bacterium]